MRCAFDKTVLVAAMIGLNCAALAVTGCGADAGEPEQDFRNGNEDAGMAGPDGGHDEDRTYSMSLTLVPILAVDASSPVVTPHRVQILNAADGKPLDPPVEGMTEERTGNITLHGVPSDLLVDIYVQGVGPIEENSSTYDMFVLNYNRLGGDPLLRISNVGTYKLSELTSGFTARPDRAAVSGAVFWAPGGVRKGAVGCATLCVDGRTELAEDLSQRYIGANGLPTTPDKLSRTLRSGRFMIGNMTPGVHTLGASLDGCKTFIGETEVFVPLTRAEAKSSLKSMLYMLAFDIDSDENPTPASCPAD